MGDVMSVTEYLNDRFGNARTMQSRARNTLRTLLPIRCRMVRATSVVTTRAGRSSLKLTGRMLSKRFARADVPNRANEICLIAIKARTFPALQGCRLMLGQ